MNINRSFLNGCVWTSTRVGCVLLTLATARTVHADPQSVEGRIVAADSVMRGTFMQLAARPGAFTFNVRSWLKGEGDIGPIELALHPQGGGSASRASRPPVPLFFGRVGPGAEGIVLGTEYEGRLVVSQAMEGLLAGADHNLDDIAEIVRVLSGYERVAESGLEPLTEQLVLDFENSDRQAAVMAFLLYWPGFKEEDAPYRRLLLGTFAVKLAEDTQPNISILYEYNVPQPMLPRVLIYKYFMRAADRLGQLDSNSEALAARMIERRSRLLLSTGYRGDDREEFRAMSTGEMKALPEERLNLMRIQDTQDLLTIVDYEGAELPMSASDLLESIWDGVPIPTPEGALPLEQQSASEQRQYWEQVITVNR